MTVASFLDRLMLHAPTTHSGTTFVPNRRSFRNEFEPAAVLIAAAAIAALVAAALRIAWNPAPATYAEYVPISGACAALVAERWCTSRVSRAGALIDAVVILLTAMRVLVPPLPFVSGHALLSAYAALTARHWPLRTTAVLVLLHVVYTKVAVTGGWQSMLAGFGVAVLAAAVRPDRTPKSEPRTAKSEQRTANSAER